MTEDLLNFFFFFFFFKINNENGMNDMLRRQVLRSLIISFKISKF